MSRATRTDPEAYDRYLKGMDASMKQKVALTAAHLLGVGDLADMGMGSGATSHALAALYPGLRVTGVDLDPEMVARAKAKWDLPNLDFVPGDIARPVFAPGSQEAILDSSVLHHVTSFGGYRDEAAVEALEAQAQQLAVGGLLVVRDFVSPPPGDVILELPAEDTATLGYLERFRREFRSLHPTPGAALTEVEATDGWRRFRMTRRLAAEFVLRKDYRADWDAEIQEAYTYATVEQFEAAFAALGLRVLASRPLWNPWIVANRYDGRFRLTDLDGRPLDKPATNYLIVGLKAPEGEGVHLEPGPDRAPLHYLEGSAWRRDDGAVYELWRRPNQTLDVLPWFAQDGQIHVVTRRSYPRPVVRAHPGTLDGVRPTAWLTEPIAVVQGDRPLGLTVEERLSEAQAIGPDRLRGLRVGAPMLPSPGGLLESVTAVWAEVEPVSVDRPRVSSSGFSTSGDLRPIEARQLLRAAAVGALPDARLEVHTAELLLSLGRPLGAWIGAAIDVPAEPEVPTTRVSALFDAKPRRRWTRHQGDAEGFLARRCADFVETDRAGEVLVAQPLEWVEPTARSLDTVAVALLRREGDRVLLGVDDDDLPAAQAFSGQSNLPVAPAWRLPRDVDGREAARSWVRERLMLEYGVEVGVLRDLGGAYHPSAGLTPELVHPWVGAAAVVGPPQRALRWVPLDALMAARERILDGHLRILSLRAARATGVLG